MISAVMIGCGPGLYRKAKSVYKTHAASYGNSHGYARYNNGTDPQPRSGARDIELAHTPKAFRTTTFIKSGRSYNNNDANSSQEELAYTGQDTGITVTKSVTVGVHEKQDADSLRGWPSRPHAY